VNSSTLRTIDRLCQRIGELHSALEEIDGLDIPSLAAVARAARLLAAADETLSRYYIRAAPDVVVRPSQVNVQ
jgi:hypothetical protein